MLVVAAVIRRGDYFLVGRRPAGKRHGGMWEFPGGKVLPGESIRDAAARELREELSLELDSLGRTLFGADDPGSAFSIHFVEATVRGAPRALEHTELAWCDPRTLNEMELAPADARFVREALLA